MSLLVISGFLFFSPAVMAGDVDSLWGGSDVKMYFKTNSGLPSEVNTDPRIVIAELIRDVLGFLGIIAVVIILFAGFRWMTSGGDEDKISKSKQMLVAGVIGLLIVLFSYALASFVIKQIIRAMS